jgi:DNA-binding transcriptional LysR family regulator
MPFDPWIGHCRCRFFDPGPGQDQEAESVDTLHSLRHFAEAARIGSLSAAARELGLSPATVSRSIDSLEKELGFSLMAKTSRGLGLTAAGAAYLPKVERILLDLAEATALAKGVHAEPKGDLKINSRVAVGNICVAPLIPPFLKDHPEITIKLSMTNDASIDLLKNDIDVDIRTGVLQDSSLIARKLADSRRLLVASPQYLAEHGEPKVPADLLHHNCIPFRMDAHSVLWRFRAADGAEHAIEPRGNFESDNGSVIRTALRAHLGIGHMTDWAVRADLLSRRLVQVLPDFEVTVDGFHHGIYAVFMPSRSQCRKVRAFIDFLVDGFRRQAFSDDPASPPLSWRNGRGGS